MLPVLMGTILALSSADEDPGRVEPDRPNIANATSIVAPGAVQFETGIDGQVHGYASKDRFRVALPQSIRIGLHRVAELRLFDGDPLRALQGQIGARQQGEVSVAAKIRLWRRTSGVQPSLGLQLQMVPANRRAGANFRALLPAVVVLATLEPGDWHLDFNLGAKLHPTDQGVCCDAEALAAASFGRSFADERVLVWGELYARTDLDRGALSEVSGDAGLIVTPTRRLALDAGLIVGRADRAFMVAVIGGLSVRLGP